MRLNGGLHFPGELSLARRGPSSIATTLGIYTHVVDASHRTAVEDVEGRLFGLAARNGPNSAEALESAPAAGDSVN